MSKNRQNKKKAQVCIFLKKLNRLELIFGNVVSDKVYMHSELQFSSSNGLGGVITGELFGQKREVTAAFKKT